MLLDSSDHISPCYSYSYLYSSTRRTNLIRAKLVQEVWQAVRRQWHEAWQEHGKRHDNIMLLPACNASCYGHASCHCHALSIPLAMPLAMLLPCCSCHASRHAFCHFRHGKRHSKGFARGMPKTSLQMPKIARPITHN